MLQSRHIVVVDFPDGTTETLYQGADVTQAEKIFNAAVAKGVAESALLFHHPVMSRHRLPLEEKRQADERANQSETDRVAGVERMRTSATQKRELAKKLTAEAKKLEAEASEQLDSKTKDTSDK